MPAYYSCGCDHPDYVDFQERAAYDRDNGMSTQGPMYADEACEDCESERDEYDGDEYDRDGDEDYRAARDAVGFIRSLISGELPQTYSPNITRAVSCEFEGTAGIQTAKSALEQLGDGAYFQYHGDSTCDGELVFGRLRLNNRESAQGYARSLAVIDRLHKEGHVKVGMRAGHHIHVSARDAGGRGMSASSLVSLYSIYSHCEDLLYRLASAGWAKHRDESSAGNWAKPIPKLGTMAKTPRNVGNAIGGDKYQGLNVSNYISNVQSCRCGAFRFGNWEECACPDDRATIEWRLWNAAVSPRKVRIYIAISHVLTDYAANTDPGECAHLVEHPFTSTSDIPEDSLARQLDWLITRPGFTNRDRDDIGWLASISPGMGRLARDAESLLGEEASARFA